MICPGCLMTRLGTPTASWHCIQSPLIHYPVDFEGKQVPFLRQGGQILNTSILRIDFKSLEIGF